jgi:hypothetical protein
MLRVVKRAAASIALALVAFAGAALGEPPREPRPAEAPKALPATPPVDRIVVRWYAPETGGIARPQFVFERELAFEARLEAFADPDPEGGAYRERHVRAALDRHIAETLLANLAIVPAPTPREVAARASVGRGILEQRVRGKEHLVAAAEAEGISEQEVDAMIARQARASLYLDRMVAPMIAPTEIELREIYKTGATPFKDQPFEKIEPLLGKWVMGQRIARALETYYQNARSRVVLAVTRRAPP